MTGAHASGKVDRSLFDKVILPRLGARRRDVVVGPRHGVDVGVVSVGEGRVVITSTDPFFVMPEYGWERAAWFALHIILSDGATSGIAPTHLTLDLNLPPSLSDTDFAEMWDVVHRECDRLGVAVVSGHTGRYEGCAFPMIGSGTVLCVGGADAYVTPSMACVGDRVIVTKGAAIETAAQLALLQPARIAAACGDAIVAEAAALFYAMSVVDDARLAASVGVRHHGVTAMHDATEFGVQGALVELAQASCNGLRVDQDRIPVLPAVRAVCEAFDMDPYAASSEGALIIACHPDAASAVVDVLAQGGIAAAEIGELVEKAEGLCWAVNGREEPLGYPASDPFWPAARS